MNLERPDQRMSKLGNKLPEVLRTLNDLSVYAHSLKANVTETGAGDEEFSFIDGVLAQAIAGEISIDEAFERLDQKFEERIER